MGEKRHWLCRVGWHRLELEPTEDGWEDRCKLCGRSWKAKMIVVARRYYTRTTQRTG
jgi:hypothetical protein